MIQRDGDMMQPVCDECGNEHPDTFDQDEFHAMIARLKSDGWKIKHEEGEWSHVCCEPSSRLEKAKALFGNR